MYGDGQTAAEPGAAGKLMNSVLADRAGLEGELESRVRAAQASPPSTPSHRRNRLLLRRGRRSARGPDRHAPEGGGELPRRARLVPQAGARHVKAKGAGLPRRRRRPGARHRHREVQGGDEGRAGRLPLRRVPRRPPRLHQPGRRRQEEAVRDPARATTPPPTGSRGRTCRSSWRASSSSGAASHAGASTGSGADRGFGSDAYSSATSSARRLA